MFDLVLTMTVGVLLRLGVPLRKIGFVKKKLKIDFLKIQKLIRADKKKVAKGLVCESLPNSLPLLLLSSLNVSLPLSRPLSLPIVPPLFLS